MRLRSILARFCNVARFGVVGLALLSHGSARARQAPEHAPASGPMLRVANLQGDASALLDPSAPAWQQAPVTRILVSRTPRIYQTEPGTHPPLPTVEVRALRAASQLLVRLSWTDPTENAPVAPAARTGEAGVPEQIYKRPTAETSTFSDAAAAMLPESWTGPEFPSLVMGDQKSPALLYYWSASRGTDLLRATGRATTAQTGKTFPAQARHADGQWTITMQLPDAPDGYPIAFAFWDGESDDRDGRKCFSIWYALGRSTSVSDTSASATTAEGGHTP